MELSIIIEYLPKFISSSLLTIELLVFSVLLGFIIGLVCSQLLLHKNMLVRLIPSMYVILFSSTPLLAQFFLIYYGLGQFEIIRQSFLWPWLREPYWCAIITLSLNTGAYTSNIMRGGFNNIPIGEIEAAKSLGFSPLKLFFQFKLVRMMHFILPTYTNEVILMLKGTALASTITLLELTGTARLIVAKTYAPIEVFLLAGSIYLVISLVLISCFSLLEKKLTPHLQ